MDGILILIFWIGILRGYACQERNNSQLPKERGVILSLLDQNTPKHATIRHIPIFLGYESFKGSVPGIKITSTGNTHVLSIDVDFRTKDFFMYDYHLGTILIGSGYHRDLNATNIDLTTLHVGVSKGTVQIAYDWLSKTVYWTDSLYRWIIASPAGRDKLDKDYYKVIVDDHLDAPDGIAVDPLKGYLFWSDNGRHPKLERSDLDGQNRHTIVTQHLKSPTSIKADIFGGRIYWINSNSEDLLSATYEGKDIRMISRISQSVLFDLAIYKDVVYVSDIYNDVLYTLNKTSGKIKSTTLKVPDETIYGIAVYGEATQPLKDKDYCGMNNCDQLCITGETGAKCACSDGYEFNSTTGLCQESYGQFHKAVVFSNKTHICLMDVRGLSYATYGFNHICRFTVLTQRTSISTSSPTTDAPQSQVSGKDYIKLLDLDVDNRLIYFATEDNRIFRRPVDLPIENDAKEFIMDAPGIISGLAYDVGYSTNLYWSESDTNNIWYVDTSTMFTKRMSIEGGVTLTKPRDIIVLPHERHLAWIAGNEGNLSIQVMTVTGRNLRTVKNNIPQIVAMIYDHEVRMFYFISIGMFHQVGLNGTVKHPERLDDPASYLFLLYNNYMVWIFRDAQYGSIMRTMDLTTNNTMTTTVLSRSSEINSIKVLDKNLKLQNASPCKYMNGGCEQVCIPRYSSDVMTKVCDCSIGFKLQSDGKSCRSDLTMNNFLLVTDWTNTALHQINLITHEINSIYNRENTIYLGLHYDARAKRLIWSEYRRSTIFSSNLDGTDLRTIGDIGDAYPYRMDKDLTTGNLYYTTIGGDNHIGVLTPSGIKNVLRRKNENEILGDIVVNPGKGWMFYTVTDTVSYIARANMDGSNERKIIIGDHVTVPDGLAIDFTRNMLYWSDAANDTIQRCDLDGRRCTTIVNRTGTFKPEEIRDLVTDGEYLYYSAYLRDHVVRLDINAPNVTKIIGQNPSLGKLDTMALFKKSNQNAQPISEACKANAGLGDCSTICLPTETGRTCSCAEGEQLKIDGKTCSNIYQCSDVISQDVISVNGKVTIDVLINHQCLRNLGDTCSYICPAFYTPIMTSKLLLTCTNVGWDRESEPLCKELVCPIPASNGKIIGDCDRRPGDACSFQCDDGFKQTTDRIVCDNDLVWTPKQICTATVSVSEAQTGVPVGGVAAIVVVLVVIIVVLVIIVAFFLLRRRRAARQSGSSAEFHKGQDGSIAIENPGYIGTESFAETTNANEHPYSTVEPGHIQVGVSEDNKLPEVSQMTQDTAVLTLDSWMKERQDT